MLLMQANLVTALLCLRHVVMSVTLLLTFLSAASQVTLHTG